MRPIDRTLLVTRRQRRVLRRPLAARAPIPRAGLGCAALMGLVLAVAVLAGGLVISNATANLPSLERLPALLTPETGLLQQPTRLYDRSGRHLLFSLENAGVPRRALALDPDVPDHFAPLLVQMIVAVDDPDFWVHPGVTWTNLFNPQPATLAERLVDNLLLDGEAPGWRRLLRMRLLAAQVTTRYGRSQVLEWYLNSAYFGHLAYGAESAARLYLNKTARDVNLAEVALLIAVEEAPALNPLDAPAAALERQRIVLDQLLESGKINDQDYLNARAASLEFAQPLEPAGQSASAFANLVLDRLAQQFGRERLERGGLRITTTLDYDLQMEIACAADAQTASLAGDDAPALRLDGAECQSAKLLPGLSPGAGLIDGAQASVAVLDVQSGQVLAYLGDRGAGLESVTTGGHAPGSLLTPFVALAGFARGMGPATLVWDVPAEVDATGFGSQDYRGPMRLRDALATDTLTPLEQLMQQVGAGAVMRLAETMGIHSLAREIPTSELLSDGGSVSLLEIAQAYSVFARIGELKGESASGATAGVSVQPKLVISVQTNAGELLQGDQPAQSLPVISAPLAYLVHDILRDSAARDAGALDTGQPAAARVGRAENNRQVWAVGYTPQRLAVTWLGLPTSEQSATLDPRAAAGLWLAVIQQASRGLPVLDWNEPAGISHVDVCDPSGLLPTAACPNVVSEIFLTGAEPQQADGLYRTVQINRETGRLATVFTPPAQVVERTYLALPPEAEAWARAAGIARPPQEFDSIQSFRLSESVRIDSPALFGYVRGVVDIQGTAAGTEFQSYRLQVGQGLNPRMWQQVGGDGQSPVNAGLLGRWDTTGLDGLYAMRLQVLRSGNRIEIATIQVTVDNTAPLVRVLYPSEGGILEARTGERITMQAEASDAIRVTRLEWLIDGLPLEQPGDASRLAWQPTPGQHRLQVRAYDAAGNMGESQVVNFEVR